MLYVIYDPNPSLLQPPWLRLLSACTYIWDGWSSYVVLIQQPDDQAGIQVLPRARRRLVCTILQIICMYSLAYIRRRGSLVCRGLAVYHQDSCLGTHQNVLFIGPPSFLKHPIMALKTVLGFSGLPGGYSENEINGLKRAMAFGKSGGGYMQIQGTKPQVSYALKRMIKVF